MSLGDAYEHLHLSDESGKVIPKAFLKIDQELWDSSRRRFTLLLDPGRIKRGLRSNLEDGPPLKEGKRYRLVIDKGWRDGNGNQLREGFEKLFRVVDDDRTRPSFQSWKIFAPDAETVDPLRLAIDEPLDHLLLEQMIEVIDANGDRQDGQIEIEKYETEWRFKPRDPWRVGNYCVRVDPRIEDLAGNNLRRPFDIDLKERSSRMPTDGHINLCFRVVGKANR
ncbi:MAG: hypothetical protein L0220_05640, partial [Acidobacteria bacterium]|nr:hypothetical protein [Acidobacteriota bacterium]